MANGKHLPPGVPNVNDAGQPNANETTGNPPGGPTGPFTSGSQDQPPMTMGEREAEEMRRMVERDLSRGNDERFRQDEDREQRRDSRRGDDEPRYPSRDDRYYDRERDDNLDMVRGGDRAYNHDDWDRAYGPTDPERRRFIRAMFNDSVLPQLPKAPGMRRCWVSTTHNYDTPQFRRGLGYHFVSYERLQSEGWTADQYAVKDARNIFAGCVMWREMIAMETDERNWYAIMRELHHDLPYEMARGIYDSIDAAGEHVRAMGGRTSMAPGMDNLRAHTRPPRQFH